MCTLGCVGLVLLHQARERQVLVGLVHGRRGRVPHPHGEVDGAFELGPVVPPPPPPPLSLVHATASTIIATAPASHQRFIPYLPSVPAFVPRSSGFRCPRSRPSPRRRPAATAAASRHADSGRRPRRDQVARLQRDRAADERDQRRDAEHHCAVEESCTTSPSTQQRMTRSCGSGTSSGVTIQGPHGRNVSMAFPSIHWLDRDCRSRADTSFMHVYPRRGRARPPRPPGAPAGRSPRPARPRSRAALSPAGTTISSPGPDHAVRELREQHRLVGDRAGPTRRRGPGSSARRRSPSRGGRPAPATPPCRAAAARRRRRPVAGTRRGRLPSARRVVLDPPEAAVERGQLHGISTTFVSSVPSTRDSNAVAPADSGIVVIQSETSGSPSDSRDSARSKSRRQACVRADDGDALRHDAVVADRALRRRPGRSRRRGLPASPPGARAARWRDTRPRRSPRRRRRRPSPRPARRRRRRPRSGSAPSFARQLEAVLASCPPRTSARRRRGSRAPPRTGRSARRR